MCFSLFLVIINKMCGLYYVVWGTVNVRRNDTKSSIDQNFKNKVSSPY